MVDDFWDVDYLKSRGLIFGGKYYPYNPKLKERATIMRKSMTLAERKLWIGFLQKYNKKGINKITVLRQKIIDNYIVDFFIPNFKMVIEIDGEIHNDKKEYDKERTEILKGYGLNEIRFTNKEIFENFKDITAVLETKLKHK